MKSGAADHHRILASVQTWRGAPMALATVVETWKSAPCPVGTHMLVHADGRFTGSVSGGCVEGDVLETARQVIADNGFALRRYGVADGAAWEVGLPCGGDIVVLVQNVSPEFFPGSLFGAIIDAQAAGEVLHIGTNLDNGSSAVAQGDAAGLFINSYLPPRRLIIVGAVEIASTLASIARAMGVDVVLIDPRARFLTAERFPDTQLDDRWPDDAIRALAPDARTAVVTLSHDPKTDDPALLAALQTPAAYIAALGSKSSHTKRKERLAGMGASPDQLARIEGPAGVAINAISAPEIALSIAGGMVRAFNDGLR
ncbi:XdhC family protein [Sphingorhabdus contaminans]|uniref:XdhC family protein n=1 Tax=Sphingorhabdus contaminans TaxID=1343899 RepID=UPI003D2BA749